MLQTTTTRLLGKKTMRRPVRLCLALLFTSVALLPAQAASVCSDDSPVAFGLKPAIVDTETDHESSKNLTGPVADLVDSQSATSFTCDGTFYLTLGNNSTVTLHAVTVGNTVSFTPIGSGFQQVNSIGFNPVDNFIYSIAHNHGNIIYRLNNDGTRTSLGLPTGWPGGASGCFAGDVGNDGTYYILCNTSRDIVQVDLATNTVTHSVKFTSGFRFADIAIDPTSGTIYGVDYMLGTSARFSTIDPTTGTVNIVANVASVDAMGATFFDPFGNLFAYGRNEGESQQTRFYSIDVATGAFTQLGTGPGVSSNDGTACAFGIGMKKTVTPATVNAGMGPVTYTFSVANQSGTPKVVNIEDALPAGLTLAADMTVPYGGSLASGGTAGDDHFTINNATIPTGISTFTVSIAIPSTVPGITTYDNQATISSLPLTFGGTVVSDDPTTVPAEDATRLTVLPALESDLELAKTVDDAAPDQGDHVTFTLTLTNNGPDTANGVEVTDLLPAGLAFDSATPSQGIYDENTGLWDIGSVANGASVMLDITVTVNTGAAVENIAEVTTLQGHDPDSTPNNGNNSEDDYATAAVTPVGSSGGNNAGVESNGDLASKMAQRLFHRRQDAQAKVALRAEAPPIPFTWSTTALNNAAKSGNAFDLADLTPAEGPKQTQPFVTTPSDIVFVTNATSVYAVDYFTPENRRLGAFFATTSPPTDLYDHTKLTCDRLGGARIEDVRRIEINGRSFIMTKHRHADGSMDYAVWFTVYRSGTNYTVESQFVPDAYTIPGGLDEILNLQVWSVSPAYTETLVADMLTKLETMGTVTYTGDTATPEVPSLYVAEGVYENGTLSLRVANDGPATLVTLEGTTAQTETSAAQAERTPFTYTVMIPANTTDELVQVDLELGAIFDVAFTLTPADSGSIAMDRVYFADGPWGNARGSSSTISSFTVTMPETVPIVDSSDYRVARDAFITGDVTNWVSLFRYLRPNGLAVDLSNYSKIAFTASGFGNAQLFIEKASIMDGNQYGTSFRLNSQPTEYEMDLESLRQTNGAYGFTAEDVTTLVFYMTGNGSSQQPYFLTVEDVRFTGIQTSSVATEEDRELPNGYALEQNYPNPFNPVTTISFNVPQASDVNLTVYDMLGRQVRVLVNGLVTSGRHEVTFEASDLPSGTYLYRLETPTQTLSKMLTLLK